MDKKGRVGIETLVPVFLIFFIFAVGIALASFVFDNVKSTQTANSTEWNATNAVSGGFGAIADLFPAIGVVIGAAFIILLIVLFAGNVIRR